VALKTKKPLSISYPKSLITLGDHIRKKRLDLGLWQKQIAEQIGVDEVTLYNWERQRTVPKLPYIPKIIAFLGYVPFPPASSLPEKIKNCRRVLGLTQEKLAKMIGIDKTTLAKCEAGKSQPTEKTLKLIEEFLESFGSIWVWRIKTKG
jgi:DNA-binding XRE family transcriptional regulator